MPMKFIVNEMPQVWYECPFYYKTTGVVNTIEHCSCGCLLSECEYFAHDRNPEYCNWLMVIKNENQ